MEIQIASLVLFLSSFTLCPSTTTASTLRSVYRAQHHGASCSLLRMDLNSNGEPVNVSYKGHCCHKKKHTDLKIKYRKIPQGLEATFQWSHDTRYYLTAKSTGSPLTLEKPSAGVTNNHRFVVKAMFPSSNCGDCVTIQSLANLKYLSSSKDGHVGMTTNRKLASALFKVHKCDDRPIMAILCTFMDISC